MIKSTHPNARLAGSLLKHKIISGGARPQQEFHGGGKFLNNLTQKLIELKTGPEVHHLLVEKLRAVLDGTPTSVSSASSYLTKRDHAAAGTNWMEPAIARLLWLGMEL